MKVSRRAVSLLLAALIAVSFVACSSAADTDRSESFPYKIEKDDLCYKLFTQRGFEWGGEWKTVKDYQHFEVSDEVARKLYPNYR